MYWANQLIILIKVLGHLQLLHILFLIYEKLLFNSFFFSIYERMVLCGSLWVSEGFIGNARKSVELGFYAIVTVNVSVRKERLSGIL